MEEITKKLLREVGIHFESDEELNGILIPREQLLDYAKYEKVKTEINIMKKIYSSSTLTSLQKTAEINQRWPLLNLVRQILGIHGYHLEPLRKSDGYTLDGIKKFKRYFQIKKKQQINNTSKSEE
jgi:hypothetical protein